MSDGYNIYENLAKNRILFLFQEIDGEVATTLAASLFWLDHLDHDSDITLYINSCGGSISDGLLTIYDTMQAIQAPVKTICIGEAYSSAAILLSAGSVKKRFAFPNSKIMIHPIQIYEMMGSQPEVDKDNKRLKKLNGLVIEMIARHTGQSLRKVKRDCQHDKFLSAQEALAYGIIDEILQPKKEIPPLLK